VENVDLIRRGLSLKLKSARESKKLTQDQVATYFGLNKGTVSAWENGRGVPDAIRLGELAVLYDISADTLLSLEPAREFSKPVHDLATALDSLAPVLRERALILCGGVLQLARNGEGQQNSESVKESDHIATPLNTRRAHQ
jgi:transcriptional regulator with XRE-family HTH domain